MYVHLYVYVCVRVCVCLCVCACVPVQPLTEEIRLKIFESPDLSVFLIDLLSHGDSVYSRENLFEILGSPEK